VATKNKIGPGEVPIIETASIPPGFIVETNYISGVEPLQQTIVGANHPEHENLVKSVKIMSKERRGTVGGQFFRVDVFSGTIIYTDAKKLKEYAIEKVHVLLSIEPILYHVRTRIYRTKGIASADNTFAVLPSHPLFPFIEIAYSLEGRPQGQQLICPPAKTIEKEIELWSIAATMLHDTLLSKPMQTRIELEKKYRQVAIHMGETQNVFTVTDFARLAYPHNRNKRTAVENHFARYPGLFDEVGKGFAEGRVNRQEGTLTCHRADE
jgi:hypothetical protein